MTGSRKTLCFAAEECSGEVKAFECGHTHVESYPKNIDGLFQVKNMRCSKSIAANTVTRFEDR